MEKQHSTPDSKISFRKFLTVMPRTLVRTGVPTATALLLAISACAPQKDVLAGKNPMPTSARSGEALTPDYAYVNKYYPELQRTGLKAKEKMSLAEDNAFGKPVEIFNYTEYALNRESISGIYDFFALLTHNNPGIRIKYKLNNNERIFSLVPESRVKSLTTLLVPVEAPNPNGLDYNGISWGGGDLLGRALSYVRIDNDNTDQLFTTDKEKVTKSFAVEACQQTVNVLVLDSNGRKIEDPTETSIAQEILCNSFGRAVAARQLGIPYARYDFLTTNYGLKYPDQLVHPFVSLDEASYSQLIPFGSILK